MKSLCFLATTLLFGHDAATPAVQDLQRAKTKRPRDGFRGEDQTAMSKVLNLHLQRAEQTLPCGKWSLQELQEFMATVAEHRSGDLQQIYTATMDRRTLRTESPEDFRAQWNKLNRIVADHPHLYAPQQEAHCREAVMWWVHHLAEEKRSELRSRNLTVPLLPESPKKACEAGEGEQVQVCKHVNEANSCDWCHSTQAAEDAGVPGASVPSALNKTTGPDDGNPQGWNRTRRCDQDQMPRCQLCEGVGGMAYGDPNDEIILTPCEVVAKAKDVDPKTVAPPLYPKQFTVKRKDGKQGGYSDTLIGWKTDPFCLGFFPQNDSTKPMCYRSEDSLVKYYDIEKEASRTEYTIHNQGLFSVFPNITASILHVQEQMWVMNDLWGIEMCICTNPSGNHCTKPPCKAYVQHWDTFKTAQHLGREKIGAEWIQNHGVGKSAKIMELDHFILWAHHIWTDPVSRKIVRAWKPFNGLQLYDPEAWTETVEDPSVFDSPPAMCKKGHWGPRIKCDDDGYYNGDKSDNMHLLDQLYQRALSHGPDSIHEFVQQLRATEEANAAATSEILV